MGDELTDEELLALTPEAEEKLLEQTVFIEDEKPDPAQTQADLGAEADEADADDEEGDSL